MSQNSFNNDFILASREHKKEDTLVRVDDILIGGDSFVAIAGPCAVENEEQLVRIAEMVKRSGAQILRGGAYKPRTSPYAFQGLGDQGLKILKNASEMIGMPVVTEVMDIRDVEKVAYCADIIQLGSRNMHNYSLIKEVAHTKKPILLKRGLCATIEEWIMTAEYILQEGNEQVILCERGIRTFENSTRNTLDLSAVAYVRAVSHLPVIVDPSHGTGRWYLVSPLAKAAYPVGAHGVMIEVHHSPKEALSDGEQSITPEKFHILMEEMKELKNLNRAKWNWHKA